jgi:hypothetical protein
MEKISGISGHNTNRPDWYGVPGIPDVVKGILQKALKEEYILGQAAI